MSEIVFINAYEFDYLGTRVLASWLCKNGFSTHNILLDNDQPFPTEEPSEDYIGYQRSGLKLLEHKAMHKPLSEKDWEGLERVVRRENPKLIGFSARSTNNFLIDPVVKTCRKVAPEALLICGGFGPTLEPDLYLEGGFDAVVRGDGEEPILRLASAVVRGGVSTLKREIPNIWWSSKYGGLKNALSDQVKHISIYPPPLSGDEHFSWISDGTVHYKSDPVLAGRHYRTYFGRGCPGKCTYCSGGHWKTLYKNEGKKAYTRRNRDTPDVISELSSLPANIAKIYFCDEYWAMPLETTRKFFEEYKEKIGIPFSAYLDYDQMVNNPVLFELVMEAGLESTGIGFQTGSPRLLRTCYEREPHYDVLLAYAERLFDNGIKFNAQFIGGNCYETKEDFEATLDLIRKLPFDLENPAAALVNYFRLRPHPESPIRKKFPDVVNAPMPVSEWHYRAILSQFSQYLEKDVFEGIRKDWRGDKTNPQSLKRLRESFYSLYVERLLTHYKELVWTKGEENWIFFGHSSIFQHNVNYFASIKPLFHVGEEFKPPERVMESQISAALEKLPSQDAFKECNIMLFTPHALDIKRFLIRHLGLDHKNIHTCLYNLPYLAKRYART